MTSDDLNQLFASARDIPVETAPEQVASWVGAAAGTSAGVLGFTGKLKLFIAKKTVLIMGTILSVASLGLIVTMSMNSGGNPKQEISKKQSTSVVSVLPNEEQQSKPEDQELKAAQPEKKEPNTPIVATVIEPIAPMMEVPETPASQVRERQVNDNRRSSKAVAPNAQRKFIVDDFSTLKISGLVNVVLKQGDTPMVSFDMDTEMEEDFQLKTHGGVLNIGFGDEVLANESNNVVYVTFTNLKELRFSGVGDVSTEGSIELDDLLCAISGVGDIELDMNCTDLDLKFSGVGDVKIKGKGEKATYAWSGVGDLKASNMKMKNVALSLSGMGDAELHATETLEVNLTGFGDVKYVGSPKTTDLHNPGNGKIKGS